MITKSASSNEVALMAPDDRFDLIESQILAALPNPVFVLDLENRFIYLNQAAEIFFQSSQTILLGTALTSIIPADTNFLSMVCRARAQLISVGDQGVELAGPKIGLKLINVQITPFGDREPRLLISIQERALAERLRGQSLFRGAARSIAAIAALLAHEVKNPLAGIKGAAQLLEADLDGDGAVGVNLCCILTSALEERIAADKSSISAKRLDLLKVGIPMVTRGVISSCFL